MNDTLDINATITIKICGPAGAGKSQLLHKIGALLQAEEVAVLAFDDCQDLSAPVIHGDPVHSFNAIDELQIDHVVVILAGVK
jgi:putative protein kinase ArgK-like GTPase of G3E family